LSSTSRGEAQAFVTSPCGVSQNVTVKAPLFTIRVPLPFAVKENVPDAPVVVNVVNVTVPFATVQIAFPRLSVPLSIGYVPGPLACTANEMTRGEVLAASVAPTEKIPPTGAGTNIDVANTHTAFHDEPSIVAFIEPAL
jgi:hypothetical protein